MEGDEEQYPLQPEVVNREDMAAHYERAIFGEQVKEFLVSPIGRYLGERAFQMVDVAQRELSVMPLTVDNLDHARELQQRVQFGGKFVQWLEEAVNEGLVAMGIIEDRNHE